jgi:hypothetical protein
LGNHGCMIPGRGCAVAQAFERLLQTQPLAATIICVLLVLMLSACIIWLLDIRGNTNWKPHTPYEPPRPKKRELDRRPERESESAGP